MTDEERQEAVDRAKPEAVRGFLVASTVLSPPVPVDEETM